MIHAQAAWDFFGLLAGLHVPLSKWPLSADVSAVQMSESKIGRRQRCAESRTCWMTTWAITRGWYRAGQNGAQYMRW